MAPSFQNLKPILALCFVSVRPTDQTTIQADFNTLFSNKEKQEKESAPALSEGKSETNLKWKRVNL